MTDAPRRPSMPPPARLIRRAGQLLAYTARRPSASVDLVRWTRDCFTPPLARREPWWPYPMVRLVETRLPSAAVVFEFGCGGSTLWLADHGAQVTAVEHNQEWYELLRAQLDPQQSTLLYVPPDDEGAISSAAEPGAHFDTYVSAIDPVADGSLDLVIVDGRARVQSAIRSAPKVRPGGHLLLDDSERTSYRAVHDHLGDWISITLGGLKAGGLFGTEATIWQRPPRSLASPPSG